MFKTSDSRLIAQDQSFKTEHVSWFSDNYHIFDNTAIAEKLKLYNKKGNAKP